MTLKLLLTSSGANYRLPIQTCQLGHIRGDLIQLHLLRITIRIARICVALLTGSTDGAQREGRTPTLLREPDFESGASASSAIRA